VIRIRYKDLAPGLHGKVERCARGVTVYLLPGLTRNQRKAVLRRLRQEASRGCGPRLPMPQLGVALGADWIRTNLKNTAAVVRLHPAGSLLPAAVACASMTLFVMASVPVRIARVPGSGSEGSPPVRGGDSAPAPARPVAGPGPGKPGGQGNSALSLAASSGTGYGGTGLGSGVRSGSGARGGPGAGSGSTSGSGTGSRAP
jgi:hypothetical protein